MYFNPSWKLLLGNIFEMSGRSAHVRKKITETKKGESKHGHDDQYAVNELPSPVYAQQGQYGVGYGSVSDRYAASERERDVVSPSGSQDHDYFEGRRLDMNAVRPLDDFAYARARKPTIKAEDMNGITKSGVRSAYDKKSDNIRKGLSKAFGFGNKKGKNEAIDESSERAMRPIVARRGSVHGEHGQTSHRSQPVYELPGDSTAGPPSKPPPNTHLPPLPAEFQVKRWIGNGRPVQRWNKLRKDPELWDPNGDVLVYFCSKGQNNRADPSLRLSSHIVESTDSRHLITMLREGVVEDGVPLPASPDNMDTLSSVRLVYIYIYIPTLPFIECRALQLTCRGDLDHVKPRDPIKMKTALQQTAESAMSCISRHHQMRPRPTS